MNKGNIKLVASDNAPSRLLQKHSEARLRLAKLITDRNSIEDTLRGLADSGTALREAADVEGNARAALSALDAEEARAMLAWSQNPSEPKPIFDVDRREKLKTALNNATAQAGAARNAASSLSQEQIRRSEQLKALNPQIREAIVDVVIEATEPLLDELKQTQLSLARQQARLNQAVQQVIHIARPDPQSGPVGTTGARIEALIDSFRAAGAVAMETTAADVAAWKSLAERLRTDPLAGLED